MKRARAVVAGMVALVLMGCGGAGGEVPGAAPGEVVAPAGETAAEASPEPTEAGPGALEINVLDGESGVPVDTLITVTPTRGNVTDVTVTTSATGTNAATEIGGDVDDDGVWTADSRLDPSARYVVEAKGTAHDGELLTARTAFTTANLSRSKEVFPTLTPIQGGPFGVAQPIVVQFDLPVSEKASFEQNLHVISTPAQDGSWGWISDKEVHYRPKEYWQPGTKIQLDARLNGVAAGNGTYGQLNRTLDLEIGKRNIAKVDLAAKQLTFEAEGTTPQTYPISAGKEGFITRSGTKVIMQKVDSMRMESETTGIAASSAEGYDLQVQYALRLTQSGEFFHAAPWNAANFGRVNASHGCTGLSTSDAYAYYSAAQIGDPVEFVGSERELEFGNGWTEWNLTWGEWKNLSAL